LLLAKKVAESRSLGGTHGGERGVIIAIVCLFGYRLLMKPADIYLIIIVGFFLFIWGVGEFLWRKSKDAGWINKAKGNMSVKKYRESIAGTEIWGIK
jgi:purine-cytosine permease-like protein